jgi:hypothetical protein
VCPKKSAAVLKTVVFCFGQESDFPPVLKTLHEANLSNHALSRGFQTKTVALTMQ